MSRQYANKFNEILLLRSKNRVKDFHKPTGITKLLERNNGNINKDRTRQGYDRLFQDHVVEGLRTRNIRGLFRVPENTDNHLVVDGEVDNRQEEREEEKEEEAQPSQPRDGLRPAPLVIPSLQNRIEDKEQNMDFIIEPETGNEKNPILASGEKKRRSEKLPLIGSPGIGSVGGFEDPIYQYEKKPKTFNHYVELAKKKPGELIAVTNPLSHKPYFAIKNDGEKIKLYYGNEALSRYFEYYDDSSVGEFKHNKVDQIRLQEHPIRFDIYRLLDDVELINYADDDDDDDDDNDNLGIHGRIKDEADWMEKVGEEEMSIYDHEHGLKDKSSDSDNDDDEQFHSPVRSRKSEDYKAEILRLKEEKSQLNRAYKDLQKILPELELHAAEFEAKNIALEENMAKINDENLLLQDLEESAKEDLEELKKEYRQKVIELEKAMTSNRGLQLSIKQLKEEYSREVERLEKLYQNSRTEQAIGMDELINKHKAEAYELKLAYENLQKENTKKDAAIRDLNYNLGNEQAKVQDLEQRLQVALREKLNIENLLRAETERYQYEMEQLRRNFSEIKEQEMLQLKQNIEQITLQKQEKEMLYGQLYNEYQSLLHNLNSLSSDQQSYYNQRTKDEQYKQNQQEYHNQLKAKDDQINQDRTYFEQEYSKAKQNLQMY